MEPLRIDFYLNGAITRSPHPIHLDSLIAGEIIRHLPMTENRDTQIERVLANLPFAKLHFGEEWVWAASTIAFRWTSPALRMAGVKRNSAENIAMNSPVIAGLKPQHKIDMNRGKWKPAQWATNLQESDHAIAFAMGDKARIEDALAGVTTLGSARRYLSAEISRIEVSCDPRAKSLAARRFLPPNAIDGLPLREGALKMPLHLRQHQTIVADNHLDYADA